MARKNQSVVTENTEVDTRPQEIIDAENHLKALKEQHKRQSVIDQARKDLEQYESEYDKAKDIFFKVNGARRVLKNAGLA